MLVTRVLPEVISDGKHVANARLCGQIQSHPLLVIADNAQQIEFENRLQHRLGIHVDVIDKQEHLRVCKQRM